MPGEFYVENKKEKFDLAEIRNTISEVQNNINQLQASITQVQTDITTLVTKSEGLAPVTGSTTADWQTAESDVVSIGSEGIRNKIHDLSLSVHNLVGTTITVRLYKTVNGVERKCYEQTFNAAADPPGLPVINGTWGIHGALRVTLQSNNAADDGKAVDYDCMLEAMQ